MSADTISRLRKMANQIAKNFEAIGHDKAIAATADHINSFWDPRMKSAIFADNYATTLEPIAAAAIGQLAAGAQPDSQTRATTFNEVDEVGRADAG